MLQFLFYIGFVLQTSAFIAPPDEYACPFPTSKPELDSLRPLAKIYQDEREDGWWPFREVAGRESFVDKTEFIKYFLDTRKQLVLVAPPNFGKSTNLQMLKHFFQIPVDAMGANLTFNMAEKGTFFGKLAICKKHPSICSDYLSSAPVVSLDLESVVGSTPTTFLETFRAEVERVFRAHGYLAKSERLSAFNKEEFASYESHLGDPNRTIAFYKDGIDVLTRLLFVHHRRKCILLVDNFDRLAVAAMLGKDEEYQLPTEVEEIYFSLGETAKHSAFVSRTLLTGVFRMGSHRQGHDDNLLYKSIFADPQISQHFGLTLAEVETLIGRLGRSKEHSNVDLHGIKHYFDGYRISDKQIKIFNTGTVVGYLEGADEDDLIPSLPLFSIYKPLFRFELLGEHLQEAGEHGTNLAPQWVISITDLFQLREAVNANVTNFNGTHDKDLLVQLLQEAGYFTITARHPNGSVHLEIPCLAVKEAYEDLVYHDEFFVIEEEKLERELEADATKNNTHGHKGKKKGL
ncbi:unnamed protein product [Bemisia tabaci]|uniref:AAA-ATPase-like domain-containing protein n=1 Tax=Bemisia tabaci TaxID=7038 RepID=A0A9P0AMZ6_BEMTA|nr:unnamed protein product [Bemisia tabaci]